MIHVTGDTHGEYDGFLNRLYRHGISRGDTVIVCGDFGFVRDSPYHRYFLARLTAEPFTIAFADGNHEDFGLLETYPVIEWNGGKAHKVADNIYHLMRGQRFVIEGRSFFVMGGAYSTDKAMRVEGKSWWKRELPDSDEYRTAEETLGACGHKADYVITHTLPTSLIRELGFPPDENGAELTDYLERLYNTVEFGTWFAGHFHVNRSVGNNVRVLLDEVVTLPDETDAGSRT